MNNKSVIAKWLQKLGLDKDNWLTTIAYNKAFKESINSFLRRFAYESALFLTTGNAGNSPMFYTDSWATALTNVADNATGLFLDQLNDYLDIDLCNPDLSVKLKIGLGLARPYMAKPDCTFSLMKKNWEAELRDPNFLNKFQSAFNPWSNDLGIALGVHQATFENQLKELNEYTDSRNEGSGFKAVTDKIGDTIKTPARSVLSLMDQNIAKSLEGEMTYTGIGIDAIDMFISTLIGSLLDKWFKEGLVDASPSSGYDWSRLASRLTDRNASPGSSSGIQGAKDRYRQLTEPSFAVRGDYEILRELTKCPDPNRAKTTECVITDKFRQAVTERLTLAEAVDKGYLDAKGVFGFISDGLEPSYLEGYPYRSLSILRKYRILPAGWELAAQYMKDNMMAAGGAKNLADMINCFDDNDRFEGYEPAWCRGLVDPYWVLKAPLNYCRREGAGAFIESQSVSGQNENSSLSVVRQSNYCADEQTCIQENTDGSCRLYGYCTEERRKWDFNAPSCDARYNTCQTYRSRDGQTVSFLQNSLLYGACTADNVGCLGYCQDYDAAASRFTCTATAGVKAYLDKDAEGCPDSAEGCHEFIRARSGDGVNILPNGGFEAGLDNWTPSSAAVLVNDADAYDGYNSLSITAGGAGASYSLLGLSGYEELTISYSILTDLANGTGPVSGPWLRVTAQTGAGVTIGGTHILESEPPAAPAGNSQWQRRSFTFIAPAQTGRLLLEPRVDGAAGLARFDAIKVEKGESATVFSEYGAGGRIYQKLAPDHLACDGVSDPPACADFVRFCAEADMGCNLFTSLTKQISVPGRVAAPDYCPAECVGYDSYQQDSTAFEYVQPGYFIPKTARACSAQAAGCDEFTNLDELGQGAEAREYYSQLRQCHFPSDTCSEFYTWEGSNETGYQLKVFVLENNGGQPLLTSDDSLECSAVIYRLPASDPAYDPDCREFYSTAGAVSYHLYSRTISCADNCHPYRRTRPSLVLDAATGANLTQAQCAAMAASEGEDYNYANGQCQICKNGGEWRADHNACVYTAIPGEGQKCQASQEGCREYSGNAGANMRILANSDFEGSTQGWTGAGGASASLSSNSLRIGGESLQVSGGNNSIRLSLGTLLREGNNYVLNFIGQAQAGNVNISARIANGSGGTAAFAGSPSLAAADWSIHEINLPDLDHTVQNDEYLEISGSGAFYIDDIRLTEISDRYFAVKDSWQTPAACLLDFYGNTDPYFNLGCDAYSDQDREVHYLHGFSRLCDEEVVGCEMMIDTHNRTAYASGIWFDTNANGSCDQATEPDCVLVPADSPVYAVYNERKSCSAGEKGCTHLGRPYNYADQTVHSSIYLLNDPDHYDDPNGILCGASGAGCEAWENGGGTAYFNDPQDQVCEWRAVQGVEIGPSQAWLRRPVRRCDANANGTIGLTNAIVNPFANTPAENNVCLDESDCPPAVGAPAECRNDADCNSANPTGNSQCLDGTCRQACIEDRNDYACNVDYTKTLGLGGEGGRVAQPTIDAGGHNWAGACPASQSGCTEYIDPVSSFSPNLLKNGDFSLNLDGDANADSWERRGGDSGVQNLALDPYALYIMTLESARRVGGMYITEGFGGVFFQAIRQLNNNNQLAAGVDMLNNNMGASFPSRVSRLFYLDYEPNELANAQVGRLSVAVSSILPDNGLVASIREASVSYQIRDKVDTTGCNGLVSLEDGCILFNERAQQGARLQGLPWDADRNYVPTRDNAIPTVNALPAENDANRLIKVQPNRDCRQWLACRSYIKDEDGNNVCFDVGLCDRVDDNGSCNHFVYASTVNQSYPTLISGDIGNLSGYSKLGYNRNSLRADLYPASTMRQIGEVALVPNGNFEIHGSNGYPLDWTKAHGAWDASSFMVVGNPVAAQAEGTGYAPEGQAFLRLGSTDEAASEFIDVTPNTSYTISAYVSTINMSQGWAGVRVNEYNQSGGFHQFFAPELFSLPHSRGWQRLSAQFTTGADIFRIRIVLYGRSTIPNTALTGNFYFDDVQLKPGLNQRSLVTATGDLAMTGPEYIPQTCRLYPESGSTACSYYEDSGLYTKGWQGYCLEYDRYPGLTDNCLLWYPVDKVKGDGVEEGAGYLGKMPVYFATQSSTYAAAGTAEELVFGLDEGDNTDLDGPQFEFLPLSSFTFIDPVLDGLVKSGDMPINRDFTLTAIVDDGMGAPLVLDVNNEWAWGCDNTDCSNDLSFDQAYPIVTDPDCGSNSSGTSHAETARAFAVRARFGNGDEFQILEGFEFYFCHTDSAGEENSSQHETGAITIQAAAPYATQLVQTVAATGQNKYWSGRVYQGSDYVSPCQGFAPGQVGISGQACTYGTDSAPFGSVAPPQSDRYNISYNPYEWDGFGYLGQQPLFYMSEESGNTRLGRLHTTADVRRLFAQSYGVWNWEGDRYVIHNELGWRPPGFNAGDTNASLCNGSGVGPRPSPDNFVIRQGATARTLTASFSSFQTAAQFYNYAYSSFNNTEFQDFIRPDRSVVFLHRSLSTGRMSVGFFHDWPNDLPGYDDLDPDGGAANITINSIAPGATMAVFDDTGEDGWNAGDLVEANDDLNWTWAACCTDGAMIEMPQGAWTLNFTPSFPRGITSLVAAYSDPNMSGGHGQAGLTMNLSMTAPVTLSYNFNNNDFCAIVPQIRNIRVNGAETNQLVYGSGFANLTFNSVVDSQQLPLVMYSVDWGDGDVTTVSGVEMRDRPPGAPAPHSLYHVYNYWDIRAKDLTGAGDGITCVQGGAAGPNGLFCTNGNACCFVQPSVMIKDNWGWCNQTGAATMPPCQNEYEPFGGTVGGGRWIIVHEKERQ